MVQEIYEPIVVEVELDLTLFERRSLIAGYTKFLTRYASDVLGLKLNKDDKKKKAKRLSYVFFHAMDVQ